MARYRLVLAALMCAGAIVTAGPAMAGEVNGSIKNHKEDFSQGKSV